ncbi:MAG TPA: hypothetical protein PLI18_16795 [Pirellulaceae bacterium]|nr:hypothetical protein [Pirellulaceae bacterium]
MKQSDFNSWLAFHATSFPSFGTLIERVDSETIEQWRGITIGCSLESMRQASADMLAGRIAKPFRDEDHVRAVRDHAAKLTAAAIEPRDNRDRTFHCAICNDSAFVTVLAAKTVEHAQAGEYDDFAAWWRAGRIGRPPARRRWYECALWCGCRIGETQRSKVADAARSDPRQGAYARMPIYDPDRHVRVVYNVAAMIEDARTIKPANFEPAFAEWNGAPT